MSTCQGLDYTLAMSRGPLIGYSQTAITNMDSHTAASSPDQRTPEKSGAMRTSLFFDSSAEMAMNIVTTV